MLSILISLIHVSDAWIGGGRGISFKVARQRSSCSARKNNIARFATLRSHPTDSFDALEELRSELMLACDEFRDEQKKQWELPTLSASNTSAGLFGSQSRAEDSVILNEVGNKVLKLVEQIAKYNPTPDPLEHWMSTDGRGEECMLDGLWKLRFTTAADATFKPGRRGPATTSQKVNATDGTLTNIIEFRENNGTLRNFRVVVEGERLSNTELELNFRKILITREPRRWLAKRFLSKFTIPLPNFKTLEWFTRRRDRAAERRTMKPGFKVLYLDEDLRIHKTTQGQVFVQSRLYDVWDPTEPTGWKVVSAI